MLEALLDSLKRACSPKCSPVSLLIPSRPAIPAHRVLNHEEKTNKDRLPREKKVKKQKDLNLKRGWEEKATTKKRSVKECLDFKV